VDNDHSFVNEGTALVEILPVSYLLLQVGAEEAEHVAHLGVVASESELVVAELGGLDDTANQRQQDVLFKVTKFPRIHHPL